MKTDDKLIFEQYRTAIESGEQNPIIDGAGNKRWYNKHGQLHREDGPACEYADGARAWFINNELHREDGPAVVDYDGSKDWWVNGTRYRSIPEWTRALFIYKGHTPEKLGQKRFDDLVHAFAQKLESIYEN